MANTYNKCYVQIVFAVKFRKNLITSNIREQVEKYITGIVKQNNQHLIKIYCNPDHTHILVALDTKLAIADLVRDIKACSSKFINDNRLTKETFRWQEGYGAFTYSHRDVERVAAYIENQEEHHRRKKFREEYIEFLNEYEIDYDDKYLFEFFEL